MTKPDVITLLENAGAVMITEGRISKEEATSTEEKPVNIHYMHYRTKEGGIKPPLKTFELIEVDGVFDFHKEKPEILIEVPEPTPPRPFHYEDATIKTGLEAENPGWEVIQIRKRRDGVLDEVTVDYSDGSNKLQTVYVVWEREDGTKDYKEKA